MTDTAEGEENTGVITKNETQLVPYTKKTLYKELPAINVFNNNELNTTKIL